MLIVTEISYHIWLKDHTRTFYVPHKGLARRANAIVDCGDLEGRGALTLDHMCYRTKELDRQRVSTLVHTQDIFEESLFFARCEVLLAGCLVSSCGSATGMAP
jgi:hypothetical protein